MILMKAFLAVLAVVVAVIGYIPYFRDVFQNKTKPHLFSWFVWGLLTSIAFVAQVIDGAGAGSWVTGSSALFCFVVAGFAFKRGTHSFPVSDWIAFGSALVAILLWVLTKSPVLSVVLITIADGIGFIPTFRKGFAKPNEETVSLYVLAAVKFLIGLFALSAYSLTTWLYPASLVLTNMLFVALLLVRRRQLRISSVSAR